MRQKLTIITLGVTDLNHALDFYEKGLKWKRSPASTDNLALFDLDGILLALYPRKLLAEDSFIPESGYGFSGITLSYNAISEAEVDEVLAEVQKLGAVVVKPAQKVFWGSYSDYLKTQMGI